MTVLEAAASCSQPVVILWTFDQAHAVSDLTSRSSDFVFRLLLPLLNNLKLFSLLESSHSVTVFLEKVRHLMQKCYDSLKSKFL
ncbi:unnamed protein product [Soboliphyme baturini]|uniref:Secreted protein n=1 Tax=Soboliphyme baturini TaxID=241478 RepID=A0A183J8X4_9BILA|nr:unnamed protein product [Soboliphyme baturini]